MTITLRLVKGSALTFAEADGNITDLNGRVVALEGASASNPIDTITISGNLLTFHYTTAAGGGSDSVTLPSATWVSRGEWQPSTTYAVNDLVTNGNRLYLVKIAHTSDTTFDESFQIGGNNVYQFIFGPMGETKTAPNITTATYTIQGTDNLNYFHCTNVSGCAITAAADSNVFLPQDSEVTFRQNAGPLTFAAGAGATLNVPTGFSASTNYVGGVVTIKKVAPNTFDLFGALALM